MAPYFTDDELVALHELDLELGDLTPPNRLASVTWWAALALGGGAMAVILQHAGLFLWAPHLAH